MPPNSAFLNLTLDARSSVIYNLYARGSESPVSTDNESETEECHWMPLVDEAMQNHKAVFEEMKINLMQSGLDEQSAGEEGNSSCTPKGFAEYL